MIINLIAYVSIILSMFFLLNPFIATAGEISGKVYEAGSDKTIPKAIVFCSKDPDKKEVIKKVLTDQNGEYTIKNILPDGMYYITVEKKPTYKKEMSHEQLGEVKKNFSLEKWYKVKSIVLDVNVASNTLIVIELTKGEEIELSTTANTTIISDHQDKPIFVKTLSLTDIKIGDKVSIKYYGTNKLIGKAAEIAIEGKNVE